jgi:hypothetical protein
MTTEKQPFKRHVYLNLKHLADARREFLEAFAVSPLKDETCPRPRL